MKNLLLLLMCLIAPLLSSSQIVSGLDQNFGNNGYAPISITTLDNAMTDVVHNKFDNKIYGLGITSDNAQVNLEFYIIRYITSGAVDINYGVNGKFQLGQPNKSLIAQRMAVQTDGKIVVVTNEQDSSGNTKVNIYRIKNNGTLDSTFGNFGKVLNVNNVNTSNNESANATDIKIQPNGNIVGVGTKILSTSIPSSFVFQLSSNGILNSTFGTGGIVNYLSNPTGKIMSAIATLPTNDIIVGGVNNLTTNTVMTTNGLTNNGANLSSYGINGNKDYLGLSNFNTIASMQLDDSSKISFTGSMVDASTFDSKLVAGRIKANGNLDSTFNGVGYLNYGINNSDLSGLDLELDSNRNLIIGGTNSNSNTDNNFVCRILANGTMDNTFMGTGIDQLVYLANEISLIGVAIQPDQKILCGTGNFSSGILYQPALFRYNNDTIGLILTSPNGGEVWAPNTVYPITWQAYNVTNINISYSANNGTSWTTIASNVNATTGNYSWTTPNVSGTNYLVKIVDANNSSIVDISGLVFSIISPSITVDYPNGGEVFTINSSEIILWTANGIATINIYYSTNGVTWNLIASNIAANSGFYNWITPSIPGTTYKVKVTDASNPLLFDISDANFTVQNPITITSPNGGEVWNSNSSHLITWNNDVNISTVDIYYSANGGSNWNLIASNINASSGSYNWNILLPASSNSLIKIVDAFDLSTFDVSDSLFTIQTPIINVTSPNGGEIWITNTQHNITWTSTAVANVKIEYTINGSVWNTIANNIVASNGLYVWTTPNNPSTTYLVRISDATNSTINDISNANFTISFADGIQNYNASNPFTITPNPATNYLFIESKTNAEKQIIIYDTGGKLLSNNYFTSNINIPINNLATGMYQMVIIENNIKYFNKFIKQ